MGKFILLYSASILFLIAGFFMIREGLRKNSYKDIMAKVHYVPVKRIGKIGHFIFGVFAILCGIILLFLKINK